MDDTAKAIRQACKDVGGQVSLARLIGVTPPTVAQWALPNYHPKRRPVPIRFCRLIAGASTVKLWELRPADWWCVWPELVGLPDAPSVPAPDQQAA